MTDALAQIRRLVAQEVLAEPAGSPLLGLLRRLCGAAVVDLPVTGCGVSLMTELDPLGMGAASDATCETLEDLQFTLGEGPCIDAFWSRRPVLEPDLRAAASPRWPMYTPSALDIGARGVFAFPLQVGAARLGVLDLYADHPGALPSDAVAKAIGFAQVAMEAVLDSQELAREGHVAHGLDEAIEHRAELFQAQGMVLVQLGVDLVDAMVRLRAYAYSHERRLDEVACDVVAGRIRLDAADQR